MRTLQPGRVVALPRDARAAVELEDPAGHVVEEVAVVGDGHHRARVLLQGPFQPRHRLGVEVVGGLVEEQEVGPGEEEPAQGDPAALGAREGGDVGVGGREAQGVHGDLEGAVEVPCPRRVDLVLEVALLGQELVEVGVRVAHGVADVVVPVEEGLGGGHPLLHVAEHVLGRVERRFLAEVADGEAGGEAGLAGVPVVLARHDPQQARLARPIRADHTDLGPGVHGDVDAAQHFPVGWIEAPEVAHGEDELGRHVKGR
jgi:hypothetical protein